MSSTTSSNSSATTTRRELLRSFAIFGGAFLASRVVAACASPTQQEASAAQSEDALVSCTPPKISANHGHSLVVSPDDVTSGVSKTYSIKGMASHDHEVTITPAQFAQLATGATITVPSTTTSFHSHVVTVSCAVVAPPPPPPDAGAGADADAAAADADAAAATTCPNGANASRISFNHGHTLVVSREDVADGSEKTYSIQGSAPHSHNVTISSAQFDVLRTGQSISLESSTGAGHSHTVTVICV